MTESGPHVSVAARNRIGQEIRVQTFEPVSLRHIKEYMAGTGDWNPLHRDDEAAAASRHGRLVAPVLMFQAVCREIVPEPTLLSDGQHSNLGVEGVTGRTVLAGQEIELGEPVHVGDVITLREYHCPIRDVAERYRAACRCEQALFRELLGDQVEYVASLLEGAPACTYRIPLTASEHRPAPWAATQ